MLLYARCSPRAPRAIRNSIVTSDPKARPTPSWIGGKSSVSKSKSATIPAVAQNPPGSNLPEGSPGYDLLYSRPHRLQRIVEEDSSSDNSSLISSNSDEGSWSTNSTRDSSVEDFSDYIFGEPGKGWNGSPNSQTSSSSSSSSSSSPLYSRHSPLSDLDRYDSVAPETTGRQSSSAIKDCPCMTTEAFLPSDFTEQYRNLTSSSRRKSDFERIGSESVNDVKYNILSTRRSSTREREP